jgi:hypothetical protein
MRVGRSRSAKNGRHGMPPRTVIGPRSLLPPPRRHAGRPRGENVALDGHDERIVLEPTAATRPEKVAAEVRSGRFTRRIGHCALFPGRCPVPIIGPEEPTRQTDTSIRATGAVYAPALFGRRTSIEALCLCLRFPREPQTNRCCCFSAKRS